MKSILLGIAAVAVIATVITCEARTPEPTPVAQKSTTSVAMVETVTTKGEGKAPDFTFIENGKTITFSEYSKGKVVLLNFWATWCGPCRREIPDLIQISKELAPRGVLVVGVALDQGENRTTVVSNFVEKNAMSYLQLIDNDAFKLKSAFGGFQSIPTTFIIDRNGSIAQRIVGMQSKEAFINALGQSM